MILVSPPGAYTRQPRAAPGLVLTKGALDRGVDENAIHGRLRGRRFDQPGSTAIPSRQHFACSQVYDGGRSRGRRLAMDEGLGQRPVPQVDVEPALMAAMPGRRGPAPWLSQVANNQQAQLLLACDGGQLAQKCDQGRVAELTVPFRTRNDPARSL